MNFLIDINHPAHVHLFKNVAIQLINKGHKVLFTTRKKEISHILLKNLNLPHLCMGKHYESKSGKIFGIIRYDLKLLSIVLKYRPDMFLSMGSVYATHVAYLLRKPNIMLQDTENARFQNLITYPFASVILNPACYELRLSKKQVFYEGYHELAYLHPDVFTPDENVLKEIGLSKEDKIIIIRFVSWNANHDLGHTGISQKNKILAVNAFSKYGKVLITSESILPPEIEQYKIRIAPEKIHHVMAFASLLFGESATMASECAVLGIPAIFIDNDGRGYTREQEKFGLVFNFSESETDQQKAIDKGIEVLRNTDKAIWIQKRDYLLTKKINVSRFLLKFIEDYMNKIQNLKNIS